MKKILLSIVALLGVAHAWAQNEVYTVDGINYSHTVGYAYLVSNTSATGDIVIPSTVTIEGQDYPVRTINSSAFRGSQITSLVLPESLTEIGSNAFQNCSSLESVTYNCTLTSLPIVSNYIFSGCTNLKSLTFHHSGTIPSCFQSASNLETLTIGAEVTDIANTAFKYCTKLSTVRVEKEEPLFVDADVFDYSTVSKAVLYVPYGSKSDYDDENYFGNNWTNRWKWFGSIKSMNVVDFEMTSNEISTFCCIYDLDFSDVSGLRAYIVSGFSPSTGTLVLTPVTEVPAEAAGKKKNTKEVDLPKMLFEEIAPKYANRNGGYTRIVKIGQRRGDGAMEVVLELV